jgi:hypothetical protein
VARGQRRRLPVAGRQIASATLSRPTSLYECEFAVGARNVSLVGRAVESTFAGRHAAQNRVRRDDRDDLSPPAPAQQARVRPAGADHHRSAEGAVPAADLEGCDSLRSDTPRPAIAADPAS